MLEQRVIAKFYIKLGDRSSESLEILKAACCKATMKKSEMLKCYKRIEEQEDVNDSGRSERPKINWTWENAEKYDN